MLKIDCIASDVSLDYKYESGEYLIRLNMEEITSMDLSISTVKNFKLGPLKTLL